MTRHGNAKQIKTANHRGSDGITRLSILRDVFYPLGGGSVHAARESCIHFSLGQ